MLGSIGAIYVLKSYIVKLIDYLTTIAFDIFVVSTRFSYEDVAGLIDFLRANGINTTMCTNSNIVNSYKRYVPKLTIYKCVPLFINFRDNSHANDVWCQQTAEIFTLRPFVYILDDFVTLIYKREGLKMLALERDSDGYITVETTNIIKKEALPKLFIDKTYSAKIDILVDKLLSKKIRKATILLYGAPGNGKSSMAQHYATKLGRELLIFSIDKDDTNANLSKIYAKADNKVILFDDFDTIFQNKIIKKEYKIDNGTFLRMFDGINFNNALIFVTTNHIDALPDNMLRARRMDVKLEVCNPCKEIIAEMCDYHKYDGDRGALFGKSMAEIADVIV